MPGRPVMMVLDDHPALPEARERLDLALTLAASDWPLTLVFCGPGVLQLRAPAPGAPLRDFGAALGSLDLFGVSPVLVSADDLVAFGVDPAALRIPATILPMQDIAARTADVETAL